MNSYINHKAELIKLCAPTERYRLGSSPCKNYGYIYKEATTWFINTINYDNYEYGVNNNNYDSDVSNLKQLLQYILIFYTMLSIDKQFFI